MTIRKFVSTATKSQEPRSIAYVTNFEKFRRYEGDSWIEVEFDPQNERNKMSYDLVAKTARESGFAIVHNL